MSFSEEEERIDEDRFIDTVREYPMLYNTKHFQYRDMQLKEKTWGRIAKEFKMDKFNCKKKWRNLRDGYQRYRKNHRKESSLIHKYARLRFLDKVFVPRKALHVIVSSDAADDDQDNDDDDEKPTASVKQETPFETEEYSDNTSERENVFLLQHDPITSDISSSSSNNTTMTQESAKKDDVEYFCLHVAEVLRKLPPVEKAKAKKQLNDVLFEYEFMAAKSFRETPSSSIG